MEEAQRHTDEQRHLADQREALHRFDPIEYFGGGASLAGCPDIQDALTTRKPVNAPRPLSSPDPWWDAHLLKREQIERDELKAFNLKYGYKP